MDTVTYPESKVAQFIEKNLVPLRIPSDSKPYPEKFNIKWTPALIVLGPNREEHHMVEQMPEPTDGPIYD
ncbi:hypothetical protein [Desulfurivibrio dismutans]|uniref:hypothetical protein n=1 Tax=Desulfurivibrio dismutans TaxID=1398908 RepID=UPI0023DAD951|nr:hypothetical protein [Desulfurivibrio alkaliphilus]MDF1613797.1 hypothetical protein [Desulfurivibrio alkaliphilus]